MNFDLHQHYERAQWSNTMKMITSTMSFVFVLTISQFVDAQGRFRRVDHLEEQKIQVGDLEREFLIHVPKDIPELAPLVFAFHGHGGNSQNAARTFQIEEHWPEAIVVYMQGIPTPGQLTDPEGKRNGWQHAVGAQDDRDLKFFDTVLRYVKEHHKVDENRIYSTGHSNGGGFTYLLWSQRPDVFAAMAPSASAAGRTLKSLKPKPVMHLAGKQDTLVKYEWQERTMEGLRWFNQCEDGKEWSKYGTLYPSKIGTPVVTYIHPGTHKFPEEAPPLIVKFFKEHTRSTTRKAE